MSNNLVQLIYDQFLEIVEKQSKHSCFKFKECDFDYRVHVSSGYRVIDVKYVSVDKCERKHEVIITIDYTNICFKDLTSCQWIKYLEKLAHELINEICPKKFTFVKDEPRKCRPQPPKWEPLPCKKVTTVIYKKPSPPPEPECEVIIEKECECVPICKHKPCVQKKQVIIRYKKEKSCRCQKFVYDDSYKSVNEAHKCGKCTDIYQ